MWKDINGFEGYQVSDDGRVRTHNKITYTEKHGFRHWKDRELVFKVSKNGRSRADARVDLWKDGKPHTLKVSRIVAFTFLGGDLYDASLTVYHIDGDFTNNNLSNLELVSLKENIIHGFNNGLYKSAQKVVVTNKVSGESTIYRSMAEAGKSMGRSCGYVSKMIRDGVFENKEFMFELI